MKCLKCIYSIFFIFFSFFICKVSAKELESTLLLFPSEIKVEFSSKSCHGLLMTGRHIATSKECEQAISKQLIKSPVKATNEKGEVLILDDLKNIEFYSIARLGSKMLLPVLGGTAFNNSVLFKINSEELYHHGLIYYMDEVGNILYGQIPLNRENTGNGQNDYQIISETLFPPGSPVFSETRDVICFVSRNNSCQIPDFNFATNDQLIGDIHKRSNDETCQVKYFQCSDVNFSTCLNNGNGEGTCTNDLTGEKCGVATYQNGWKASYQGQTLYCNNKDGCEVVICPSSCVGNASGCTCTASYKLNDLTRKKPCDCIEFTDSSLPCSNDGSSGGISEDLKYGLGFGIGIGIPFVVLSVAAVVIAINHVKKERSIEYVRTEL